MSTNFLTQLGLTTNEEASFLEWPWPGNLPRDEETAKALIQSIRNNPGQESRVVSYATLDLAARKLAPEYARKAQEQHQATVTAAKAFQSWAASREANWPKDVPQDDATATAVWTIAVNRSFPFNDAGLDKALRFYRIELAGKSAAVQQFPKFVPQALLRADGTVSNENLFKLIVSVLDEFGGQMTVANLQNAAKLLSSRGELKFEAKSESNTSRENQLGLAGVKANTGRKNHTEATDDVPALSDQKAQEMVMQTLSGLSKQHPGYVKEENTTVKQLMSQGKSWQEINDTVRRDTLDYLASVEIHRMIEGAPGGIDRVRMQNREQLHRVVTKGRELGMRLSEIVHLVKSEYEGMRGQVNTVMAPRRRF